MAQDEKNNKLVLDIYKDSLQPIVDEVLAVQNLAPATQEAIVQNKPLNDAIRKIVIDTAKESSAMRKAVADAARENKIIEKSQVDYKQPGFWIPIAVSAIIGITSLIIAIIK